MLMVRGLRNELRHKRTKSSTNAERISMAIARIEILKNEYKVVKSVLKHVNLTRNMIIIITESSVKLIIINKSEI